MEIGEIVLNFFIGFTMYQLVMIGGYLSDIRDELKKLNENRK